MTARTMLVLDELTNIRYLFAPSVQSGVSAVDKGVTCM